MTTHHFHFIYFLNVQKVHVILSKTSTKQIIYIYNKTFKSPHLANLPPQKSRVTLVASSRLPFPFWIHIPAIIDRSWGSSAENITPGKTHTLTLLRAERI